MNKVNVLIESHRYLVYQVFEDNKYDKKLSYLVERDDLIQQGMIGLIRASKESCILLNDFMMLAKRYIEIEFDKYIKEQSYIINNIIMNEKDCNLYSEFEYNYCSDVVK